jgi:transcriptional regulator with XRE-family HTH domain
MVRLGARLRRLRLEQGVSQRELERRSGLQASYLSKLENDVVLPGLDNLDRIARSLGFSLSQVLAAGPARRRRSRTRAKARRQKG